jgi:integrase
MIDRNPIDKKIEKPPMPSRGGELCLSAWDTVLVIDASPKDFKQAMEFMYLTGARPQVIYLAEARHYNRQAKCLVLDDHKTKAHQQNLVVHLCPKAIAIVEELVAKHPTGKLFRRRHGGNWNSHHITTRIATIRRRLPLVKNIFARGARHTYAVDALKSGVKVETVASLLGHKGIGMVMTHYAPLTTLAEQAQDALKRFRN